MVKRHPSITLTLALIAVGLAGLYGCDRGKKQAGTAAGAGFASALGLSIPAHGAEVRIDNFSFDPATLTVAAGTRVTWVNRDDVPHTATSTKGVFKSAALDTDDTFSYVFQKPGTYPYYCAVHPHMTGEVVVLGPGQ